MPPKPPTCSKCNRPLEVRYKQCLHGNVQGVDCFHPGEKPCKVKIRYVEGSKVHVSDYCSAKHYHAHYYDLHHTPDVKDRGHIPHTKHRG